MITIDRNININEARAAGPYFVHHEGEAGGGFYDIALEPRLLDWPDIAHAGLIELKYLKPGDPEPTQEALAAIKAEAIDQLDRYCADPALVAKCHLKRDASSLKARSADLQPAGYTAAAGGDLQPAGQYTAAAGGDLQPEGRFKAEGGTVSLHRLVLVFKGGDCILHEEV